MHFAFVRGKFLADYASISLLLTGCGSGEIPADRVARLQKLADQACLCNRAKGNPEVPRAMAGDCSKTFRSEVERAGFERAPVAPDGPLTSYDLYVGPTAPRYDSITQPDRPMPPTVRIDRSFNACTQKEEDVGFAKLGACQKRKGYGPEEDGRCWNEFY